VFGIIEMNIFTNWSARKFEPFLRPETFAVSARGEVSTLATVN